MAAIAIMLGMVLEPVESTLGACAVFKLPKVATQQCLIFHKQTPLHCCLMLASKMEGEGWGYSKDSTVIVAVKYYIRVG